MEEKSINEKESIEIILKMIQSAKNAISDNSIFYLLWGWLVLIALVTEYLLLRIGHPYYFIGWAVFMPAGFIVSLILGARKSKRESAGSYLDVFMGFLWGGFVVSLLIVLWFIQKLGPQAVYPVVFVLYGLGTFVSGGILKFRPLIAGGIICWATAVAALYVPHDVQILLGAGLMLAAYIVPGYLLRLQHRQQRLAPSLIAENEGI